MSLVDLNHAEREVVRECLTAAIESTLFPEWEFHTLFGLERRELKRILVSWPGLDENDKSVVMAINNSFNNLLGYPAENRNEEWSKFISASEDDVARIFDKWKGSNPHASDRSRGYFDNLM